MGKVLPAVRSLRISSSPLSFGSPRSMTAMSSGYSLPANNPSSPSAATSTVKPCFTSCSRRPSRNEASSSTTSARMFRFPSAHPAGGGIDADRDHAPALGQQFEYVNLATVFVYHFGANHACVVLGLGHAHGLVQRNAVALHTGDGAVLFDGVAAEPRRRHAVRLAEGRKAEREERGGHQALSKLLHGGREFNCLHIKGDVGGVLCEIGRPHADGKQICHHSAGVTSTRTRIRLPGLYGSCVTWARPWYW